MLHHMLQPALRQGFYLLRACLYAAGHRGPTGPTGPIGPVGPSGTNGAMRGRRALDRMRHVGGM
jgi:hypothetical protein